MRSANGRAASAAACARRSLEAATICMALVIFCVALVAAMRTRMSLREAIPDQSCGVRSLISGEGLGVVVDHVLELAGSGVVEIARVADLVEDVAVLAAQQRQQVGLELAHLRHLDLVEI